MRIIEFAKLINEYDGDIKSLKFFIQKTDKIWAHIATYDQEDKKPFTCVLEDKKTFLLVLQTKLTKKAFEAVKDNPFNDWNHVKESLIEGIIPYRNAEKAELELKSIKQKPDEDIEIYAERIKNASEYLNMNRNPENQINAFKAEDDRKATRVFENGLFDLDLRNNVIARGNQSLREAVEYTIQQKLRQQNLTLELEPSAPQEFCDYCKIYNHATSKCRRLLKQSRRNNIICHQCRKKGHYADECDATNRSEK